MRRFHAMEAPHTDLCALTVCPTPHGAPAAARAEWCAATDTVAALRTSTLGGAPH
eukprot:SAG11_NODE_16524_length_545_cov_0.793722_1_plen_54_part_10